MNEFGIRDLPLSLQQFVEFERFYLHKAGEFQREVSSDPLFDPKYLPQNCSPFRLPCFYIPRNRLRTFGGYGESIGKLHHYVGGSFDDLVLFPIHPLTLSHFGEFLSRAGAREASAEGINIYAVPTSSVRTLLIWRENHPYTAIFIKTTMLSSPQRADRRIYANKLGYCLGVTKILEMSRSRLPQMMGYFNESCGLIPHSMSDGGLIVRPIPSEIWDRGIVPLPVFALLGGERGAGPLIVDIAARAGMSTLEFVESVLCRDFARLWLELALRNGLYLEAHGQNLMIALGSNLVPLNRFIYRDFEGLFVDWELRRATGIRDPDDLPYAWSWYQTYGSCYPNVPYCQLVWWKLRVSLHAYLHFVLHALNSGLQDYQRHGFLGGPVLSDDAFTQMFSRYIRIAIREEFGVCETTNYDVYRNLKRFAGFLLTVRSSCIANNSAASAWKSGIVQVS